MAVQIGSTVNGLNVTEVGQEASFTSNGKLLPVKFEDGTYTVLAWDESQAGPPKPWLPDNEKAAEAIKGSTAMPIVHKGIGTDVIHVHGVDSLGEYLVKLFYNYKKSELGREDELYRCQN